MADSNHGNYPAVVPYLILSNAVGFIAFAEKVFGAKLILKKMREETPEVIMHAELKIETSIIMVADTVEQWTPSPAGFFMTVKNADETFQLALDNGASIVQSMSHKEYGRTGGVSDSWGNTWWITSNTDQEG